MKKQIIAVAAFFTLATLFSLSRDSKSRDLNNTEKKDLSMKKKQVHIVIISLNESPIVARMRQGLIETINSSENIHSNIRIYNANGKRTLLRSQMENILEENPAVLITLGMSSTLLGKELIKKRNLDIPIVFAGIADPIKHNIVDSMVFPKENVTGVCFNKKDYFDEYKISLLFKLRKHVKKIIVPFDNKPDYFKKEVSFIEKTAKKYNKNIEIIRIPIENTNEVLEKTKAFAHKADAIITLRDNIVVPSIEGIAKICKNNGITLYSLELDSVKKGAGLGYGQDEYHTGVAAAKKVLTILKDQKNAAVIPITSFYRPEIHVNTKTMSDQMIDLINCGDKKLLKKIKKISTI